MNQKSFSQLVALLISGLGIGWLLGLSVSPVVSIVISSLTGATAAILTVFSSIKDRDDVKEKQPENKSPRYLHQQVNVWPLAVLVIGIVLGTVVGLQIRTRNLLSPAPSSVLTLEEEVRMWVDLGLSQEDVVQELFDERVKQVNTEGQSESRNEGSTDPNNTILFSDEVQAECIRYLNLVSKKDVQDLRVELSSSAREPLRNLPDVVTDDEQLFDVVESVLCFGVR